MSYSWQTVEMMGYAYYSERGYRLFAPLVKFAGYDFIAEKDGEMLRVNVKLAWKKDNGKGSASWAISSSGASRYKTSPKCDVFLVYFPEHNLFAELPGDFLCGGGTRKVPKKLVPFLQHSVS